MYKIDVSIIYKKDMIMTHQFFLIRKHGCTLKCNVLIFNSLYGKM